jgi:hypothetical protein
MECYLDKCHNKQYHDKLLIYMINKNKFDLERQRRVS